MNDRNVGCWDKDFVGQLNRHYACHRCGFYDKHVEAGGMYYCPNCGAARPHPDGDGVYYEFGHGCSACARPGHQPLPGFMEEELEWSPRVALGLAPHRLREVADAVARLQGDAAE